jgi:hypothetical protein
MLTIKTDVVNVNWLKYIVSQFKSVNLAEFDIEIVSIDEEERYENVVYYCKNHNPDHVNIFNSNAVKPNGDIEYIKKNLFILKNTKSVFFELNYDIFWNAFVFLSRYEEYLSEKNGNNIYSYSLNHPRIDKDSFGVPVVNVLFNDLELFLKDKFPNLMFKDEQKDVIDLSHDVDYISKTIQLRLKQTAFNLFNTLKSVKKPRQFVQKLIKTVRFAFSNPSYWCFDYWMKLEGDHGYKSTFYIYAKNGSQNFKSWLLDPSYDIRSNIKLQNKLKELYTKGFDIGLHGSYDSAKSLEKLKKEKNILEQSLGIEIKKTRQHWLNYFEEITPEIHENLFKYDSTLAWNDRMGFRSGIASIYTPYNFKKQEAYSYQIIPQIIMDSNVYDYSDSVEIFNEAKNIMQKSKDLSKTTHVSISWHQRVCSNDYNWNKFYEEIIDDI